MLITTEMIVLKAVRYSDTASIVQTYSKQLGALSFKVSRPTRRSSVRSRAFFLPLSLLEVTLDYRPMREIHLPREVQVVNTLSCVSYSAIGNAVALFCTDLLSRLLRTETVDEHMYSDIRTLLLKMDGLEERDLASFHLEMLLTMIHHLGISPQTDEYRDGYVLNIHDGTFQQPRSSADLHYRSASHTLYQCLTQSDLYEILQSRRMRNELLNLLISHIAYHYPILGDLRSPKILSELF